MPSAYDFTEPEFSSYDAFLNNMIEDEREEFNAGELQALAARLHLPVRQVRLTLEGLGLTLAERSKPRKGRGHTTSSNDRWYGPGSSPSHGGSGWEEITGFAGRKG